MSRGSADATAMKPVRDRDSSSGEMDESDLVSPYNTTTTSITVRSSNSQMSMVTRVITVAVLLTVNLLNYMDRYTIAGVLSSVEDFFGIGNGKAGLLQASFIIGYMIFSPIFGYCGDRYNRKWLMIGGIVFWSAITLSSSFVTHKLFSVFVILRALVGVGEASYSTIAPTIISDMFVGRARSLALMAFYFAIPFGSGLGYIVGSNVAKILGNWAWALRITPGLGVVCCLLLVFFTRDPPRGMAEQAAHLHSTSVWKDVKALLRNKSFMFDTLGFTCVAFIAGALALFAPDFLKNAYLQLNGTASEQIPLYFGILTCGAGIFGILIGTTVASYLKNSKAMVNGDAIVCAVGMLGSAVSLFFALLCCQYNLTIAWILIFIGMTMVCLNWALVADIVLYTVVPTRRSTAEAMQIFVSHLLGDAGSPYLLGTLSDYLRSQNGFGDFESMQKSLYCCCFVAVLGGGFFLACSLYIENDKARAHAIAQGATEQEVDGTILPVEIDQHESERGDDAFLIAA